MPVQLLAGVRLGLGPGLAREEDLVVALDEPDASETVLVLQEEVDEVRELLLKDAEDLAIEAVVREVEVRVDAGAQFAQKGGALLAELGLGKEGVRHVDEGRVLAPDHVLEDSPGEGHFTEMDRK